MLTLTLPLHLLIAASFRSSYFPVKITVPDSRIDNTITDLSNDDTVLLPEITSLLNNSGLGLMKLKMHTDGLSISSPSKCHNAYDFILVLVHLKLL